MYQAEVLRKLPVVQQFLFGSVLPYEGPPPPNSDQDVDDAHRDHAHVGGPGQREVGWGDCCGIPVPSIFGAAKVVEQKHTEAEKLSGSGIRPVPFD
jgi:serine/threonine-protein phosphatase 2A activator